MYLLRDPSNPAPEWLKRDFADSGLRVRAHPWTGGNITTGLKTLKNTGFEIPFEVWKRDVTDAAVVILGALYNNRSKIPCAMYGIAVKVKTNGD